MLHQLLQIENINGTVLNKSELRRISEDLTELSFEFELENKDIFGERNIQKVIGYLYNDNALFIKKYLEEGERLTLTGYAEFESSPSDKVIHMHIYANQFGFADSRPIPQWVIDRRNEDRASLDEFF